MSLKIIFYVPILLLASCNAFRASEVMPPVTHSDSAKDLPASKDTDSDALSGELEALRERFDVPGVSVAIIDNSRIARTVQLGLANIDRRVPVQEDTLFQACSITKTLTSALVLKVLKERQIPLGAPANRWLRRWKIPGIRGDRVTIRMLLNHTAGISDPYPDGGSEFSSDRVATLTEHFLGMPPASNPPLRVVTKPGKKFSYCNGCYAILQMLVEDITGEDYRQLVDARILKPLGMNQSTFDTTLLDTFQSRVARNYNEDHRPFQPQRKMPIYATGSLSTTAKDLALFARAFQESLLGQRDVLLSKDLAQLMIEPSSTPVRGLGFFLGNPNVEEKKDGRYFFHAGQNVGYLSLLMGSLDGKVGAVVMINISSAWDADDHPHFNFIREAIRAIAQRYHWDS